MLVLLGVDGLFGTGRESTSIFSDDSRGGVDGTALYPELICSIVDSWTGNARVFVWVSDKSRDGGVASCSEFDDRRMVIFFGTFWS